MKKPSLESSLTLPQLPKKTSAPNPSPSRRRQSTAQASSSDPIILPPATKKNIRGFLELPPEQEGKQASPLKKRRKSKDQIKIETIVNKEKPPVSSQTEVRPEKQAATPLRRLTKTRSQLLQTINKTKLNRVNNPSLTKKAALPSISSSATTSTEAVPQMMGATTSSVTATEVEMRDVARTSNATGSNPSRFFNHPDEVVSKPQYVATRALSYPDIKRILDYLGENVIVPHKKANTVLDPHMEKMPVITQSPPEFIAFHVAYDEARATLLQRTANKIPNETADPHTKNQLSTVLEKLKGHSLEHHRECMAQLAEMMGATPSHEYEAHAPHR